MEMIKNVKSIKVRSHEEQSIYGKKKPKKTDYLTTQILLDINCQIYTINYKFCYLVLYF